jgi:lipoate-protein ligase A
LELTLPTPAENLALDEALLEWAEAESPEWEFLRVWESPEPIVVVGRSSRVHQEVHEGACRERGIPILRRSSGGAAIVAGAGCLMYGVVLSYRLRPELKDIGRTHAFVLGRLAFAIESTLKGVASVTCDGTSDLVFIQRGLGSQRWKFSGNSMRAKRSHLLYHGTMLYDFDLTLLETCLQMPPRQPEYRGGRSHREFVANLPIARQSLEDAIDCAWPTSRAVNEWPTARVERLVAERYSQVCWNLEFG